MGLLLGKDIAGGDHRHSGLSFKLRSGVLDSLLSYPLGLARLIADAAVMSHPGMDVDKAPQIIKMKAYDAIANIDYMTGGMTGGEALSEERMKAVAVYKDMRRRLMKEN
jgi:hypothetical protein